MGIGEKNWGRRDQENKLDRRRAGEGVAHRSNRAGGQRQPGVASRLRLGRRTRTASDFRSEVGDGRGLERGELLLLGVWGLSLKLRWNFFYLVGRKFRYAKAYQAHPLGPPMCIGLYPKDLMNPTNMILQIR